MHEIVTLIASGYHQLLHFLNAVPGGAWSAILASPFLSGALQGVKHWLSIQNEKLMLGVVTVICFLAGVAYYLHQAYPTNPMIVGAYTAILGFTTQPFYYLFIKPLYKKATDKTALAAIGEQDLHTAAIPPGGVPFSGTVVSAITNAPVDADHAAFQQSITLEDFSK